MSVFVDKENVGSQYRPSSLKAGINNPAARAIQVKSVVTNTRSTTARKPLGSVNSSRDAKKSTGDGKGAKEWGDDIKAKVVADVKPTATLKKTGLIARPVNKSENKENGSKTLLQEAKKDSFEKAPTKPVPLKQKLPEIVIPKQDVTDMHRGLDDNVDYPDSPIEQIYFPLPVEEEDDFQDLWPVDERPTAFIKDIMNWGIIPSRRKNHDSSNASGGSSPVQCDYTMMNDLNRVTLTDDEADEMWSKGIASFDDLPPLPALAALDDLFGEDDAEYFSHLE